MLSGPDCSMCLREAAFGGSSLAPRLNLRYQRTETLNEARSFGKRAGKVCRFFENVEQGLGAVDAVAFGLCRLFHNSDALQPFDCAL